MPLKRSLARYSWLVVAAYLGIVTVAIFWALRFWGYDDPYITYRYARNLAQGAGFVYNPGERILSTTTPLFAVLLALLSGIWPAIPQAANFIGAASLAIGGLLFWDLARSWEAPLAGWAGLLLYPSFSLLLMTLGSETPLYLAFCLGALAAYARQRYSWSAVAAALALLIRPDAALLAMLLGLDFLVRKPYSIPWRAVAVYIALALPWFLFAWAYFGSPMPVTLFAKQQQAILPGSRQFGSGFTSILGWYRETPLYWLEAGLALLGLGHILAGARRWLLLLGWAAAYFLAYTLLRVSNYYWYYAPLVPAFVAAIGMGLAAIPALASMIVAPRSRVWHVAAQAAALLLVVALTAGQIRNAASIRQSPDRRLAIYRAAGQWLQRNTPPEARVATLEAGLVGYYAQRPMIDFAGLVSPQVATYLDSESGYATAAQWVARELQPEYLVIHGNLFPDLRTDYISTHCQLVHLVSGLAYGYPTDLEIYHCSAVNNNRTSDIISLNWRATS